MKIFFLIFYKLKFYLQTHLSKINILSLKIIARIWVIIAFWYLYNFRKLSEKDIIFFHNIFKEKLFRKILNDFKVRIKCIKHNHVWYPVKIIKIHLKYGASVVQKHW